MHPGEKILLQYFIGQADTLALPKRRSINIGGAGVEGVLERMKQLIPEGHTVCVYFAGLLIALFRFRYQFLTR